MARLKTLVSWSSGKDSAWALHRLRTDDRFEVIGLVTTVNSRYKRVAMHGVRRELLHRQAEAAALPLLEVPIPSPCTNEEYESAMMAQLRAAVEAGAEAIAFGDLFLEDIRRYREAMLQALPIQPLFPLWGVDTSLLANEMIAAGLRARITCLDPRSVPRELAGAEFDAELMSILPPDVDRCGERGEFHTFAYEGPMFEASIPIEQGEVVERDGFVFADLLISRAASS